MTRLRIFPMIGAMAVTLLSVFFVLARPSSAAEEAQAQDAAANAERPLLLPAIFGDHMVIQRGMPVTVWGTAKPGRRVTVRFRDQVKSVTTDPQGNWRILLDPLAAPREQPGYELTVSAEKTIVFKDVLIGEVWLGSGQSNMVWPITSCSGAKEALAEAGSHSRIRLSSDVRWPSYTTPGAGWVRCSPGTVKDFSALMYYFALKLEKELDVPVGLISRAVGGAAALPWISRAAFMADQGCREQYSRRIEKSAKDGKPEPDVPGCVESWYKGLIAPVVGYAMRGVLWDQGEAGSGAGGIDLVTAANAVASSWRREWQCGDFLFIYVQKPSGEGWHWSPDQKGADGKQTPPPALPAQPCDPKEFAAGAGRVAFQDFVRRIPNSVMCTSLDLDSGLHPSNKNAYGRRLADIALARAYRRDIEYYGPLYESHAVEGGKVRVRFTHTGKGLVAKDSEKLRGFAVAGEDRVFQWAEARIDGRDVLVWSPAVSAPVAVRYAWAGSPVWANLFNVDGLPALTFRTDDWPPPPPPPAVTNAPAASAAPAGQK